MRKERERERGIRDGRKEERCIYKGKNESKNERIEIQQDIKNNKDVKYLRAKISCYYSMEEYVGE